MKASLLNTSETDTCCPFLGTGLPCVASELEPGRRAVWWVELGIVTTDTVEVAPAPGGTRLFWRADIAFTWPLSLFGSVLW